MIQRSFASAGGQGTCNRVKSTMEGSRVVCIHSKMGRKKRLIDWINSPRRSAQQLGLEIMWSRISSFAPEKLEAILGV